jgi:signal transduction histidine kinase
MPDRTYQAITLRSQRLFLGVGAALYMTWWAVVEALLPGSFNPLASRVAVVATMLAALGATYVTPAVARHAGSLLAASMGVVTLHYGYLIYGNHGDPTWWAGCVLVVACVGAMPLSRGVMVAYSLFALALTSALMLVERRLLGSIFLPSIATILLLSNVGLRTRLRLEEERQSAHALRLERDRAEEASKLKSLFLGLVSHELVTPLQSIRLNAEHLAQLSGPASEAERAAAIGRIERGARRLTELIESLLEYTRVEAGRLELRLEDLDLCAIANDVVDELAPQARSKGLELRLRLPTEHHTVKSDPRLVRLILTNLATNAVRYTDHGSVEVAVADDGAGHHVSVADTGRGIPPEARDTIFEAFTQLEPLQRKHLPGIGLGLALVKQLTAALGARVEVTSKVGAGTTFTVTFP